MSSGKLLAVTEIENQSNRDLTEDEPDKVFINTQLTIRQYID